LQVSGEANTTKKVASAAAQLKDLTANAINLNDSVAAEVVNFMKKVVELVKTGQVQVQ